MQRDRPIHLRGRGLQGHDTEPVTARGRLARFQVLDDAGLVERARRVLGDRGASVGLLGLLLALCVACGGGVDGGDARPGSEPLVPGVGGECGWSDRTTNPHTAPSSTAMCVETTGDIGALPIGVSPCDMAPVRELRVEAGGQWVTWVSVGTWDFRVKAAPCP